MADLNNLHNGEEDTPQCPQTFISIFFDVQCLPKFRSESLGRARNFLTKITLSTLEQDEGPSPTDLELAIEADEQGEGLNFKIRLLLRRIFDYLILLLWKQSSLSFSTTSFAFTIFDSHDSSQITATLFLPLTIQTFNEFESAVEKHLSRLHGTEPVISIASSSNMSTKDSIINQSEEHQETSDAHSVASWVTQSSKHSYKRSKLRLSNGKEPENNEINEADFDRLRENVVEKLDYDQSRLDLTHDDFRPTEGQSRLEAVKAILEKIVPMLGWPNKGTKVVSVVFEVPKKLLEYQMSNIGEEEMKLMILPKDLYSFFINKGVQLNFLDTSKLLTDPLRRDVHLEGGLNVEGEFSLNESPMKRGDVVGAAKSFLNTLNGGELLSIEEVNNSPPEYIPYAMLVRKWLENEKVCEKGGKDPFTIQRMLAEPIVRTEPQELEIYVKIAREEEKTANLKSQKSEPFAAPAPVVSRGMLLAEAARKSYLAKQVKSNSRRNKRNITDD